MRLIDADVLKKEFPKDTDWEYPVNTNEYVCEKIDEQPTIGEQKKGKWIEQRCRILWWECSECGRGVLNRTNFCPNCGADMRG